MKFILFPFKILKKLLSVALKLLSLPLILLLTAAAVLANIVLHLGAYVVGPFMLFVFCCGVYTASRQIWMQTGLLAGIELCTAGLYFGAAVVLFFLEDVRNSLSAFVWG